MRIDGAHSRQPAHSRKRKAPESSQDTGGVTPEPPRKKIKTESKPSASLCDLPAALQAKICSHLRGDPYQTVRDMTAFRYTSQVQFESLLQEGYPWTSAQELRPMVRAVGQCFREEEARLESLRLVLTTAKMHQEFIKHATVFGPALGFLSPRQQGTLVKLVDDLPGEKHRSIVIKSLGRELAHLEVPQRENLVNAALRLTCGPFKADAITGLVASLEHLDPPQRDKLVATAINLPNDHDTASALQALGPKLALLKEDQCKKLAKAAADLKASSYAQAGAGLFKGLADMDPARREIIVSAVVESFDRARLSPWHGVDLLPVVEYFGESQREKIILFACVTLNCSDGPSLGDLFAKVAPAVEHLGKPFRDAMFNTGINVDQSRSHALRGLGMWIAHLDEAQREVLLRAASSIQSEKARAHALGGMAAGVVHLDEDGRNTLIAEVKRLKDYHARNAAIRDFGESESLQHLSPAHRQALIGAASSPGSIVGLAKSLRHLTQPEHELLLEAVERLGDSHHKAKATVALAKATSEALLFREPDMRDQ